MTDAGVLHAAARLRIAEEMTGMLHRGLQQDAVRVAAAAAHQETHRVHQRERPARDRRQLFAFFDVLPVANVGATNVLGLIEHDLIDAIVFLVRVFVLLDLLVLAGIARSFAFMTRAGAQGTRNQLAALVVVASFDVLQHQAPGELALLFFDADDALDRGDAIARPHVPEKLPVVARVEAVHAGQTPTSAAEPAECHREHRVRQHRAVASRGSIADIPIQRVEIANAIAPVAQGVGRRVLEIGPFGTQVQADHGLCIGDRFVGDETLGRGGTDVGGGRGGAQ